MPNIEVLRDQRMERHNTKATQTTDEARGLLDRNMLVDAVGRLGEAIKSQQTAAGINAAFSSFIPEFGRFQGFFERFNEQLLAAGDERVSPEEIARYLIKEEVEVKPELPGEERAGQVTVPEIGAGVSQVTIPDEEPARLAKGPTPEVVPIGSEEGAESTQVAAGENPGEGKSEVSGGLGEGTKILQPPTKEQLGVGLTEKEEVLYEFVRSKTAKMEPVTVSELGSYLESQRYSGSASAVHEAIARLKAKIADSPEGVRLQNLEEGTRKPAHYLIVPTERTKEEFTSAEQSTKTVDIEEETDPGFTFQP